jgi:hypothetical protein
MVSYCVKNSLLILFETAEIASINPLYPPILGDFFKAGGHPQTPGRKNPAPLFQWSLYMETIIGALQ